jgi:hypothetical protein
VSLKQQSLKLMNLKVRTRSKVWTQVAEVFEVIVIDRSFSGISLRSTIEMVRQRHARKFAL